jgi:hypothetical protein
MRIGSDIVILRIPVMVFSLIIVSFFLHVSLSSSECPGIHYCFVFFHLGFYVEKSDHRMAWNRLMKKRGKNYLIVKAQRPGHVRSNTF